MEVATINYVLQAITVVRKRTPYTLDAHSRRTLIIPIRDFRDTSESARQTPREFGLKFLGERLRIRREICNTNGDLQPQQPRGVYLATNEFPSHFKTQNFWLRKIHLKQGLYSFSNIYLNL